MKDTLQLPGYRSVSRTGDTVKSQSQSESPETTERPPGSGSPPHWLGPGKPQLKPGIHRTSTFAVSGRSKEAFEVATKCAWSHITQRKIREQEQKNIQHLAMRICLEVKPTRDCRNHMTLSIPFCFFTYFHVSELKKSPQAIRLHLLGYGGNQIVWIWSFLEHSFFFFYACTGCFSNMLCWNILL